MTISSISVFKVLGYFCAILAFFGITSPANAKIASADVALHVNAYDSLKRGCNAFSLSTPLTLEGGGVALWIKPEWGYYEQINGLLRSHTMLSGAWSDGAYFVLSDGWWEHKGGELNTYFVLHNASKSHVKSATRYQRSAWVHLAVTWQRKDEKRIEIAFFVNGIRKAHSIREHAKSDATLQELYLGCDKGVPGLWQFPHHSGRAANSIVQDLFVTTTYLDQRKVTALLSAKISSLLGMGEHESDWPITYYLKMLEVAEGDIATSGKRFIFDDGFSWSTQKRAMRFLDRIAESGFTTAIVCIWHGDGARYDSAIAPHATYKPSGDPLRYLMQAAEEKGIQIIPWITVSLRKRDFLKDFYNEGTPPESFDLHFSEFHRFIARLTAEVVAKYGVKAILLDYVRTKGVAKSRRVARSYRNHFGRSWLRDLQIKTPEGRRLESVIQFQAQAVSRLLNEVKSSVQHVDPDVKLFVASHAFPSYYPHDIQGRNPQQWLAQGLVDHVFDLNYDAIPDVERFQAVRAEINDNAKITPVIAVLDIEGFRRGIRQSRSPKHMRHLVRIASIMEPERIAIYNYSMMTNDLFGLVSEMFSAEHSPATGLKRNH